MDMFRYWTLCVRNVSQHLNWAAQGDKGSFVYATENAAFKLDGLWVSFPIHNGSLVPVGSVSKEKPDGYPTEARALADSERWLKERLPLVIHNAKAQVGQARHELAQAQKRLDGVISTCNAEIALYGGEPLEGK